MVLRREVPDENATVSMAEITQRIVILGKAVVFESKFDRKPLETLKK